MTGIIVAKTPLESMKIKFGFVRKVIVFLLVFRSAQIWKTNSNNSMMLRGRRWTP